MTMRKIIYWNNLDETSEAEVLKESNGLLEVRDTETGKQFHLAPFEVVGECETRFNF